MLMRTPEPHRPGRLERLIEGLIGPFRRRPAPAVHGRVDDLPDRLRADIGAPPRLPARPIGPADY